MERKGALIAAIASAACFGTLAVFTRLAYSRGALPLQLLTWRFGLAALLLGGYVALKNPRRLHEGLSDLGRYALISFGGYGAASICFFFALTFADAAVVAVLLYTYPAIVVLAERTLFGVTVSKTRGAAVALSFAGCVLVVAPFSGAVRVGVPGLLLGLAAACGYTSFTVASQRLLPDRPRTVLMTYLFFLTALMAFVAALLTSTPLSAAGWGSELWLLLAGIVLLPTFVAILLYLRALRHLGAGRTAIASTFEPVFTIVLASILLGERMTFVQLVGAALVMAGVVVAERSGGIAEEPAIV